MIFNPKPEEGGSGREGPIDLEEIYSELDRFFTNQRRSVQDLKEGGEYWEILGRKQKEALSTLIEFSDKSVMDPHILHRLNEEEKTEIRRVVVEGKNPQNVQVFGNALEKIAYTIRQRLEGKKNL